MNSRYFADVNDYTKYCILRQFLDIPKIIYWMLTTQAGDGTYRRRLNYLSLPQCANLDRELYDHLWTCVSNDWRDVSYIEGWLGDVVHYEKRPIDNWAVRKAISDEVISMASKDRIVFLDPDNGYQVPTYPEGTSRASKYVYASEIGRLLEKGAIIILFQHLRMGQTVDSMIQQFSEQWKGRYRFAVRTSYVVYYFLSNSDLNWAMQRLEHKKDNKPHTMLHIVHPR